MKYEDYEEFAIEVQEENDQHTDTVEWFIHPLVHLNWQSLRKLHWNIMEKNPWSARRKSYKGLIFKLLKEKAKWIYIFQ